jgi:hypothetical protein
MKMMMAVVTLLNLSASEARAERELPPYDAPLRILWEVEPVEQYMPVIDWLAERGWCWGIEARAFTQTEAL